MQRNKTDGVKPTISPLMQSLNQTALDKARQKIKKKFSEPSALEDIAVHRVDAAKKLSAAEAQLTNAVKSKLNSLKYAEDMMNESTTRLLSFCDIVEKVEYNIFKTNTTISSFTRVSAVHFARENLNKVIQQVEFFTHISDSVLSLRKILAVALLVYINATNIDLFCYLFFRSIRADSRRFIWNALN